MATDPSITAKMASNSTTYQHGGISDGDWTQDLGNGVGRFLNTVSGKAASAEADALEAQKARDWSKMMSDTAHQREVADLHAAGLNPASMDGGSGASTPQAAQGHADSSGNGILQFLAGMARSAIGAVMTKKMIDAGASDHGEYRKMMGEYYSAKNALQEERNTIASIHEAKNRGNSMAYSHWKD